MNDNLLDKTKVGDWVVRRVENRVRPFLVRLVPSWIETYHLTLLALLWTAGVLVCAYLAQFNREWLWLSSFFILAHYLTDFLDGTIGRIRNTGLLKWGYYVDHFFDYLFFTSLLMSYGFIFPPSQFLNLVLLCFIQTGFLISIFLRFSTTNTLAISFAGIGASEVRLGYVLLNIFIIFFGVSFPTLLLPWFTIFMALILVINVFLMQKKLWQLDMAEKNSSIVK